VVFAGKRPTEILMNVAMKRKHPPIPDGLPEPLQAALRGCFVHDPTGRCAAQDVMAALRPMVVPAAGGGGAGGGGGGGLQVPAELERRLVAQESANAQLQVGHAQLQAVNTQLQTQVATLSRQIAEQAVQAQRCGKRPESRCMHKNTINLPRQARDKTWKQ
jgi:hypothetical protein